MRKARDLLSEGFAEKIPRELKRKRSQFRDASVSFSYLIALARISSTILNKGSESGHLYLVTQGKGKALTFTINYDVKCRFFVDAFYQVNEIPSCS